MVTAFIAPPCCQLQTVRLSAATADTMAYACLRCLWELCRGAGCEPLQSFCSSCWEHEENLGSNSGSWGLCSFGQGGRWTSVGVLLPSRALACFLPAPVCCQIKCMLPLIKDWKGYGH